MKSFNKKEQWFMLCTVANRFYVNSNVHLVNTECLHLVTNEIAYYFQWEGIREYSGYLTIKDIECVIKCVKIYYGQESYTYKEWYNLYLMLSNEPFKSK